MGKTVQPRIESRTGKSVKNAKVALVFYVVNLVLQFFSRKIFLDYLGAEVLGLNTTVQNVLQFLNLAEMGVGTAVAVTLYKPITMGDRVQMADVVSLQGWFYRRISKIILAGAVVLTMFFPWIFAKADVVWWYPYATFAVMLVGMLGSYVFNYKQILLSADQKEYKVLIPQQSIKVAKILFQIGLIVVIPSWGYPLWLVLELLGSVVTFLSINRAVGREYPWLKTDAGMGAELRRKYPKVLTKTKQLFFHKIGSFALMYTTVPIIYAYASLTVAAIYGNYMLILGGVTTLVNAVYNSIAAGVGSMVAEGNRGRIIGVFRELFSSRFLMAGLMCFVMWKMADSFITLWVGPEYLLDKLSLALMVGILFINLTRGTVDSFIYAYGLFHDIWAPITEAALNIGLAILMGAFWGLPGIVGGVFISLVVIIFTWKPILLFRRGLRMPVRYYVVLYLRHIPVLVASWVSADYLIGLTGIDPSASWLGFVCYGFVLSLVFGGIMGVILMITEKGMRDFVSRVIGFIKRR